MVFLEGVSLSFIDGSDTFFSALVPIAQGSTLVLRGYEVEVMVAGNSSGLAYSFN